MRALRRISEPVTIARQSPTGEIRIEVKGSMQDTKAIFDACDQIADHET